MTRVDFYLIAGEDDGARLAVAGRLAEKAYGLKHHVYIHAADATMTARLDELLWTFRDGSFLPHARRGARPAAYTTPAGAGLPAPVLIGDDAEPPAEPWDLLINLHPEVPAFFSRYHRLAELIGGNETQRALGRQRYRFYRDRGYELHTHDLASN